MNAVAGRGGRTRRLPHILAAVGFAVLCPFLQADPVLAQTLGQGSDDGISLWRVVAALLLCMALAVAGAFAMRARLGPSGTVQFFSFAAKRERRLQLVEALRLSQKVDLCLVTCDGDEMLVLASEAGAQVLDRPSRPNPRRDLPAE